MRTLPVPRARTYDQRLSFDGSQWWYCSKETFESFGRAKQTRYLQVAAILFDSGVIASIPCTRCRSAGVCSLLGAQKSCAYCILSNRSYNLVALAKRPKDVEGRVCSNCDMLLDEINRLKSEKWVLEHTLEILRLDDE